MLMANQRVTIINFNVFAMVALLIDSVDPLLVGRTTRVVDENYVVEKNEMAHLNEENVIKTTTAVSVVLLPR